MQQAVVMMTKVAGGQQPHVLHHYMHTSVVQQPQLDMESPVRPQQEQSRVSLSHCRLMKSCRKIRQRPCATLYTTTLDHASCRHSHLHL